jgi:hypothetical protein
MIEYMTKSQPTTKSKHSPQNLLLDYCKNMNEWPFSWEIDSDDIRVGKAILEHFKAFLLDKIEKRRSKKTIKNDSNYLWALGAELISRINENDEQRRLSPKKLILHYIDDSGGPLWHHASSELEHNQYDSLCKQLFKFIKQSS